MVRTADYNCPYVSKKTVLIIFPVFFQTVINLVMPSIAGQGAHVFEQQRHGLMARGRGSNCPLNFSLSENYPQNVEFVFQRRGLSFPILKEFRNEIKILNIYMSFIGSLPMSVKNCNFLSLKLFNPQRRQEFESRIIDFLTFDQFDPTSSDCSAHYFVHLVQTKNF